MCVREGERERKSEKEKERKRYIYVGRKRGKEREKENEKKEKDIYIYISFSFTQYIYDSGQKLWNLYTYRMFPLFICLFVYLSGWLFLIFLFVFAFSFCFRFFFLFLLFVFCWFFFYLAVSKLITVKTQNIVPFVEEHSYFIKYILDKLDWIIWIIVVLQLGKYNLFIILQLYFN